jgi:hypothetical protein
MSFAPLIAALGIPAQALVEQRVPKKLLLENGAPTAADKRQIQDGIEETNWVAALKPTNIGVPAFDDGVRQYLEIAVLTVELRPAAKPNRLIELIHRAIPYPLVLIAGHDGAVCLSLAHKRWSQGEAGKVVVETLRQVTLTPNTPSDPESAFLASIAVSRLPAQNLFTLYDGMLVRLTALEAASLTGTFTLPDSSEHGIAVREGLDRYATLEHDLELLRSKAGKEKQINRRVELNLEIQRIESILGAIRSSLQEGASS